MDAVKQRPTGRPLRLVIGVDDVLPKEIAFKLIEPALRLPEHVRVLCREAGLDRLVAELTLHELDVVLSDAPITPSLNIRAYSHPLGDCGVVFMGTHDLTRQYRPRFPRSLNGAPVLLPTDDTAIRRNLDLWFAQHGVRPVTIGEFEDYGLLRVFGQAGTGVFPVPSVLERQFREQLGVRRIGVVNSVRGRFYAVTVERKIQHPAVLAICEAARKVLFA
jgi:LysR family transcriptional activator of nhaA